MTMAINLKSTGTTKLANTHVIKMEGGPYRYVEEPKPHYMHNDK